MELEWRRFDELAAREIDEWDEFASATLAPPFLRPGWLLSWAAAFDPESRVVLAREAGALRAVLPVSLRRKTIRSATNRETAMWQPVIESDPRTLGKVLRELFLDGANHLAFSFLSGAGALVSDAAANEGLRCVVRSMRRPPIVDVGTDWGTYLATYRTPKERKEIRRKARRLGEQGEISYSVHDGSDGVSELLETAFTLEASGWKGTRQTAVLSRPAAHRYYVQATRWAAANGLLRLRFLHLQGRQIAFQLLVEQHGIAYLIKIGHDEALQGLSPGILLLENLVEASFESPTTRTLVLCGESERFKEAVATGNDEQVRVDLWADRLRGILGSTTASLSERAHEEIRNRIPIERRTRFRHFGDKAGSR